ncbi:hypothetical protein WJX73_004405 [Symbiochloris irregularis]|uniref:CPBP family intramembrane metalloprotease n=1 Tax=Symbiochloris irregularis TaxID=706552 RepID=A0AAW1PKV3_9CHLO
MIDQPPQKGGKEPLQRACAALASWTKQARAKNGFIAVPWTFEDVVQVLVLFAIFHTVAVKWVVEFALSKLEVGLAQQLGTTARILCNFLVQAGHLAAISALITGILRQYPAVKARDCLPVRWHAGKLLLLLGIVGVAYPITRGIDAALLGWLPSLWDTDYVTLPELAIASRDPVAVALSIADLVILAPLWEEVLFRGVG